MSTTTQAAIDVLAERQRQVSVEGWTADHDDAHEAGAMAAAGGSYAVAAYIRATGVSAEIGAPWAWPWDMKWWKPGTDQRRMLVKAGALILAEIERLDRAAGMPAPMQVSTTSVLVGQILVMASLLERSLPIVKNVEAEGSGEGDEQDLIEDIEAAITTVLKQHAMQPTTPTNPENPMSITAQTTTPPAVLAQWSEQGGTYIGIKATPDGKAFYVVAAIGDHELVDQAWGKYGQNISGADSYHDGRANTEAMAAGGAELGKKVLALDIGGHTDWALPSQADGHLLAANAKHLMNQDDCYWLSTQYSANHAWCQGFHYGGQDILNKDCEFRAVPVRCIQIV